MLLVFYDCIIRKLRKRQSVHNNDSFLFDAGYEKRFSLMR